MTSTYQRLKRRRDAGEINGFTLIELLIVIVVLGILAAVVIFALGGITGKSQVAACQADGATVSTALSAFHAENPTVATSGIQQSWLYATGLTSGDGIGGPYIQSWPGATVASNGYVYTLSAGKLHLVTAADNGNAAYSGAYTGPGNCKGA